VSTNDPVSDEGSPDAACPYKIVMAGAMAGAACRGAQVVGARVQHPQARTPCAVLTAPACPCHPTLVYAAATSW